MLGSQRFQHDMVIVLVHDSARALIDFKIFSKPPGNHYLPFDREHNGIRLWCWIHTDKYYATEKVSQPFFL